MKFAVVSGVMFLYSSKQHISIPECFLEHVAEFLFLIILAIKFPLARREDSLRIMRV